MASGGILVGCIYKRRRTRSSFKACHSRQSTPQSGGISVAVNIALGRVMHLLPQNVSVSFAVSDEEKALPYA